jgi:putative endonuclease
MPEGPQHREEHAPAPSRNRRKAFVFGLRAETAAMLLLRCKGYSILARRYLAAGGEIDIIASRGDTIVFVEVKARPTLEEGAASITFDKARRMSRAARNWLARNPNANGKTWRGDAIFLAPWRLPQHAPGFIELQIT